jgi:hypothetical protein
MVFDLCPWFLLVVAGMVGIAEFGAVPADGVAPHLVLLWPPYWGIIAAFALAFVLALRPGTIRQWINVLSAALILPLGNAMLPFAVTQTIWLFPHVYDARIAALDGSFGLQPSFAVAEMFVHAPALHRLFGAIYATLLFPIALVAAVEALRRQRMGLGTLPTFLVLAAIGYVLYALLPAIGPAAHFGDAFPLPHRDLAWQPRNAMPSLHTAWVLMAFLATRGMSLPIRLVSAFWLFGTLVATLGLGEHYLADLVVAVPFVLTVRAICEVNLPWSNAERRISLLAGTLQLLWWALVIRGGLATPAVPFCMLTSVVVSLWLERRLAIAAGLPGHNPALSGETALQGAGCSSSHETGSLQHGTGIFQHHRPEFG